MIIKRFLSLLIFCLSINKYILRYIPFTIHKISILLFFENKTVIMEALLKMFLKFLVLLFVVVSGTMAVKLQDLPPCCEPHKPCDPEACERGPCCRPPSRDMKY
jgi:hypothetical protein